MLVARKARHLSESFSITGGAKTWAIEYTENDKLVGKSLNSDL